MPSFITASTASGAATPSITQKAASLMSGMRTRLETKPGESLTATGFFSSFSHNFMVVSKVSWVVCNARNDIDQGISGRRFKKSHPKEGTGLLGGGGDHRKKKERILGGGNPPGPK